jgi:hypothetical protein
LGRRGRGEGGSERIRDLWREHNLPGFHGSCLSQVRPRGPYGRIQHGHRSFSVDSLDVLGNARRFGRMGRGEGGEGGDFSF